MESIINAKTLSVAAVALVIDMPWLYLNQNWSSKLIRGIQGSPISLRVLPAIIVYLAIGYLISIAKTPGRAAAIGVAAYAIYDFTNYATLTNYDPSFAVVDTLWGGALFALTFVASKQIGAL